MSCGGYDHCTFADNVVADNSFCIQGSEGTDYRQNEAGTGSRYYPSTIVVENCLFANNRWQAKGNVLELTWDRLDGSAGWRRCRGFARICPSYDG